jgi:hypothetical protein
VVETDIPSPRVQTGVSTPRVLNRTTTRLRSILKENEIFPTGTEIMKNLKVTKYIEDKLRHMMKKQTSTESIIRMETGKR